MPAASAVTARQSTSERGPMVWIEDRSSRIARGQACSVTREGLQVRLSEAPAFGQGDDVVVRVSLEPGAPTVSAAARVAWVRGAAGQVECGLQWSAPPTDRKEIEAWLAKAA